MSSTLEGSDDWVREDELDLGQEDEAPTPNGLDHVSLRAEGDRMGCDGGEFPDLSAERASGLTKHAAANDSPPQHRLLSGTSVALGSPGETASTPDDTPSQHVSHVDTEARHVLTAHRALSFPHKIAAR